MVCKPHLLRRFVVYLLFLLLIVPLCFRLHDSLHFNFFQALQIPTLPPQKLRCFIYDRPPHTASTTVAVSIKRCLLSKHYNTTTMPYDLLSESEVITDMLSQCTPNCSAVTKHLSISASDIAAMHSNCSHFLYVTSTRSMAQRIFSSAKYVQTEKHGHSNLTKEQVTQAMATARGDRLNEERLERYPFVDQIILEPHYIVRHDNLTEDLKKLLSALGCKPEIVSQNIHVALQDGEIADLERGILEELTVSLKWKDARHLRMLGMAALVNEKGLQMASRF